MKKEKMCYDGYLVRNLDPITLLSPYIMPRRTDSQVLLDLKLDLTKVEKFIREQRENIPGLTLYHVVFATVVRAAAITPEINRFIAGNRLYQRRHVKISMMVKRALKIDGDETGIFPTFETSDTLADIVRKTTEAYNAAMEEMNKDDQGAFDKLLGILEILPTPILKAFIKLVLYLDGRGKLPKFLTEVQPFHSSFFVTNVGSIGLPVIYHHLYEFGTTSGFVSMGAKESVSKIKPDGSVETYRVLPLRFVLDSRICDGFTYSTACRTIKRCFMHPEMLLESYQKEA
ncbi:MAG: hypothetical protein MJ097_03595 [Dorea sp.]|nr:hypothetical protein [Dorea sp.]